MARRLAAAALLLLVASIASAGNTDWNALVDAYGRLNATQRPEFVKILVRKSPAHAERAVRNLVSAYPGDKSSIASAATAAAPSQAAAIRKAAGAAPSVMKNTSGMGSKATLTASQITENAWHQKLERKVNAINALPAGAKVPKNLMISHEDLVHYVKWQHDHGFRPDHY